MHSTKIEKGNLSVLYQLVYPKCNNIKDSRKDIPSYRELIDKVSMIIELSDRIY